MWGRNAKDVNEVPQLPGLASGPVEAYIFAVFLFGQDTSHDNLLIKEMERKEWLKIGILLVLTLLSGLVWYAVWRESRKGLTVIFLNVGQGDAIYIEAPNGNQMLIDGGRGREALRELGAVMPLYDRSIDVVLSTHPDADHIGGLIPVFESYTVGAFVESGNAHQTAVTEALSRAVTEEKSLNLVARRGMRIHLGRGVVFTVLYPDKEVTRAESNEASVAGRLAYGMTTVLLTGDAPIDVERILMAQNGSSLKSTVLKLGHHGSRTSSLPEFLSLVHPEFAIISAGKRNRYGHPHQEVLDTLQRQNIRVLRTDVDGRITLLSDGKHLGVSLP